jgi:hypothetical protein
MERLSGMTMERRSGVKIERPSSSYVVDVCVGAWKVLFYMLYLMAAR